ncbi:hypothetical protein NM208_g11053 [Fusarium decemcellulare]|uniref:Uncharacterized protein n=1 Tax=Fusarium decemcellulare TaxID=57161 RepID=A0ACC1RVS0_9HYPO|nr:hypothetical protein NM208_g11053 [Fusarium decemcellulare]
MPQNLHYDASNQAPNRPISPSDSVVHLDIPPETLLNQLMHYYATELAPINVWVDSRNNEYTRLVVPLAKSQPALRFAILGIAAAHQNCQLDLTSEFSQSACRTAILLITDRMRTLTNMELDRVHAFVGNEDKTPEAVLAATLVLCNHSLLEFNLPLALFHLRAARALVKTIVSERQSSNELFVFLRNQVASLDVLACTTLFTPDLVEGAVLPELKYGPIIFGDYLHIIHDVTLRSLHSDNGGHCNDDFFSELEDRFELARASTLIAVGRLMDLPSTSYQHDVVLLVEAFHHAGLVYASKRLQGAEMQQLERHHCSKLFRLFRRFDNIGACLANLSWPIFVAGISSCSDAERTCTVRDMLCRLTSSSPFRYYANIPAFFKELWASPDQDWIALAREWEGRGTPVLAM